MATTADFRNGFTFQDGDNLFSIVEFLHVKPGKGGAFVRTKLRNVKTKAIIERTFRAGEKVDEVRLERRPYDFLYRDGDFYFFMCSETYNQIQLAKEMLGDASNFLIDNCPVEILFHGEIPIELALPKFVEIEITHTEPGFKGNTAQNKTKPATLVTGQVINVPLFIDIGNIVKIDTDTGEYIERVTK
ncbi:MAG: elongation factor P [Candidatus Latescibacteria bacterium]|nr:elongation factor P [Candidatus Latescibacterota bacterium]